eukprot:scaffold188596_cov30-Tisochrysis_lutea.AAC.3
MRHLHSSGCTCLTCTPTAALGPNGRHEPDEAAAVAMLDLLEQSGYTGHVGCEYKPVADVVQGLVWARSFGITAPEHHG